MADGLIGSKQPNFDAAPPTPPSVFESYPSASWSVPGNATLVFPVQEISEEGGNRIVNRERPYRDGAKIDDVGSKPKMWTFRAYFENSIEEGASKKLPLYPDVLNALIRSFDTHQTGDLVVPTVGKVRARAMSYRRDEKNDERDAAVVEFKFIQDNEDKVDATAFTLPTVKASLRTLQDSTTFSAQSDATFSSSLADLNEFSDNLVAIANFPGNTMNDIDSQAGIVVGAVNRVATAFTSKSNNPKTKARAMLSDPDASITQRRLVALADTASRARSDLRNNDPPIVTVVLDTTMNIFEVATQFKQDPTKLINLNSGLDLFRILAKTSVRIYDTL
jgi:prophage DNA circulation protein